MTLAIGLTVWAGVVVLFSRIRPIESRDALTMQLSLTLLRYDEGFELLLCNATRSDVWWEDADPTERRLIDRALSMWDLAAWYVAAGRIDGDAVVDVFAWHIVDLWEQAYPYVMYRRDEEPSLWSSLSELYLDAYDASGGRAAAPVSADPEPAPRTGSVSPEELWQDPIPAPVTPHEAPRVQEASAAAPQPAHGVSVNLLPGELRRRRSSDRPEEATRPTHEGTESDNSDAVSVERMPSTTDAAETVDSQPPSSAESDAGARATDADSGDRWLAALRNAEPAWSPATLRPPRAEPVAATPRPTPNDVADKPTGPHGKPEPSQPTTPLSSEPVVEQIVDLRDAFRTVRDDVLG